MIQILYTNDSSYNERVIAKVKECARTQESNYVPPRKRKTIHAGGMIISSLLLIIVVGTVWVGLSSWNLVSEARTQEDIIVENLPEFSIKIKQNIQQTVLGIDSNTIKETRVAEKELVVKKALVPNGKYYDTVAYLSIPSLGIKYPVLAKTTTELLKVSLNKYWGANPNQVGNFCIVGHNYNDNRFFGKLNQIKQGAEIIITEMDGEALSYYVYQTDMIDPYDTSCTSQLTNGRKEITLITCNYDGSQRFIAKARAN